jgi:hypothetical protein
MNKILVFYFFVCAVMFLCLTAIFTIADIGQYLLPKDDTVPKNTALEPASQEPPPYTFEEFRRNYRSPGTRIGLPVPKLIQGYMYAVSAPILLYDQLDFDTAYSETLPTGGVFQFDQLILQKDSWVYRVTVSNGRRNYEMYLRDDTLPQTRFYGRLPSQKKMAHFQERQERSEQYKRDKEKAGKALQSAYELAIEQYYAAEAKRHPKNPIIEALRTVQARLETVDSEGVLFSGMIAALLTLFIAVFLGTFTLLRNTRAWEGDLSFDDLRGEDRGADYYEENSKDDNADVDDADDPVDGPFS